VQPRLVAEVEFSDWTPEQQLRHAKFIALRADKTAAQVRREDAVMPAGPTLLQSGGSVVDGIKVSNPERVVDAQSGVTKLELVRYYESVAQWMLPHLKGRPCSLVRGPNGVAGELFYQKHLNEQAITEVRELPAALWPGHPSLIEIPTRKALVAAAQLNVIEFHTWNATEKKIGRPDRVIFDLDPGEGVPWQQVQEAALLVRGMLTELGLQAWLKTSGGKGLHVVVPLTPREGWDAVKAFSESVVQHMAKVIPQRFVAKSGAANRVGRIFIDFLRNGHGATTAAAFSARSRPGLGVSMPIAWEDLGALKGGNQWTVRTAREHLSFQQADPWEGYWACKQTIAAGVKALSVRG
jgi:bifunctional non-homologous end joining protein LigD